MTDYNLIFGAVLLFNVAVTFRASSYYKKYFPSPTDTNKNTSSDETSTEAKSSEELAPLSGENGGRDSFRDNDKEKNDADLERGGDPPVVSTSVNAASDNAANIRHAQLLRKYLIVYLLAALSDWLQGPYVYALYDAYGYSQHEIAVLFVAGFGSSMVFGSFIGGMADQCGRRKFIILFAVIYAMSCMTKRKFALYSYFSCQMCIVPYLHVSSLTMCHYNMFVSCRLQEFFNPHGWKALGRCCNITFVFSIRSVAHRCTCKCWAHVTSWESLLNCTVW